MNQKELIIQEDSSNRALDRLVQGEFLQSEEWRKFQESVGRKIHNISDDIFCASIIEHQLPIVGKYFYIPRGPIITVDGSESTVHSSFLKLINLAKKEKAGWIRIEPADEGILKIFKECICLGWAGLKIQKAPHDMQPREILVMDITKSEGELLAGMKAKTRYNVRLAEKKGVQIRIMNYKLGIKNSDIDKFVDLVKITAKRDGITPHPESYYRKMFETIPAENLPAGRQGLKLYVAEYNNKIIAANIMIFYGNVATYLHGASDNEFRNVMAPYFLQWQAILDAKEAGCMRYNLGGVKTEGNNDLTPTLSLIRRGSKRERGSWQGITRFKTGFSPNTKSIEFPGSYDIIINKRKYFIYKFIRKLMP